MDANEREWTRMDANEKSEGRILDIRRDPILHHPSAILAQGTGDPDNFTGSVMVH
jgi:hypothetical protein